MAIRIKYISPFIVALILSACSEKMGNTFSTILVIDGVDFYRVEIEYIAKYKSKTKDSFGGYIDPYSDINPSIKLSLIDQINGMNNEEFIVQISDGSLADRINNDIKKVVYYLKDIEVMIKKISILES